MKVFGKEVKGKTVAITVGIGAVLALLYVLSRRSASPAQATSDATNALDVQDDSALGTAAPVASGGATSGVDASLLGPLLSFEAQSQQNTLLAQIQQAQVAAAQQVQSLQAELNAKVASQAITAQQNEAQISANTSRTNTAISVGIPAVAGILTKIFGGGGGSGGGAPSFGAPSAPGFSGGAPNGGPVFAEESLGNIASFGAFNLI